MIALAIKRGSFFLRFDGSHLLVSFAGSHLLIPVADSICFALGDKSGMAEVVVTCRHFDYGSLNAIKTFTKV